MTFPWQRAADFATSQRDCLRWDHDPQIKPLRNVPDKHVSTNTGTQALAYLHSRPQRFPAGQPIRAVIAFAGHFN
jgi:hypothetical protein